MKLDPLPTQEALLVREMTRTDGWEIVSRELKNRYEDEYKRLRKCKRDSAFYKIQGYLNAIDEVFLTVDQKLEDVEGE